MEYSGSQRANLSMDLSPVDLGDYNNIESINGFPNQTNQSFSSSLIEGPYLEDLTLRYVFLVANLVIFLFGLLGNALVIYIIALFAKVRNKSVANYYIWNLAFADILCIAALPLFGYNTFTSHWPFGKTFCKIGYVLRDINKFTSVFTLVALSVDRYLATFHRMAYLRTIQVGKIICLTIWLLSFLIAMPYFLFARTVPHPKGTSSCRLVWPNSTTDAVRIYMKFWTYFQLAVGLLIPFAIIIGSYILLMHRFRTLIKLQAKSRIRRSGRKMTQTVIAVVFTFLFCQAPYHAINIANIQMMERYRELETAPTQQAMRLYAYINGLAQVLVYISSCCNPIIYALLNENFRKLYAIVLCSCRRGKLNMEDLRNMEMDGKYIPVSLRIRVTFHLPCSLHSSQHESKEIEEPIYEPHQGQPYQGHPVYESTVCNEGKVKLKVTKEEREEPTEGTATATQATTAV